MIRPVVALGIDPGAHAGASLVRLEPAGRKPALVAAWPIWGTWPGPWHRRAKAALEEARAVLVQLRDAEEIDYIGGWIEDPPVTSRRGSLKGDKKGQVTWAGMGRRQGALMVAAFEAGLSFPTQVLNIDWRELIHVPHKQSFAWAGNELVWAERMIAGSRDRILEVVDERPLEAGDVAESMLVAGACCLNFRYRGKR